MADLIDAQPLHDIVSAKLKEVERLTKLREAAYETAAILGRLLDTAKGEHEEALIAVHDAAVANVAAMGIGEPS